MEDVSPDTALVAFCGLFCGACPAYLKKRCAGCRKNEKAKWCKVRTCNLEKATSSCAECAAFSDPMGCKKYNNIVSKIFGFLFRSNRAACIEQIKRLGIKGHADIMAAGKRQTIKR